VLHMRLLGCCSNASLAKGRFGGELGHTQMAAVRTSPFQVNHSKDAPSPHVPVDAPGLQELAAT
jgi:hypothetical protein